MPNRNEGRAQQNAACGIQHDDAIARWAIVSRTTGTLQNPRQIGQGAFGDVYRARDTKIEADVALKILAPFVLRDPEAMGAVEREAKLTRALKHPNIVTVYDFDETQGFHFLVMDFVEGEALEAILKTQGALALDRLLKIAEQLASALDYAHAKKVLHRDIKPSNILISPPDALHPHEHVTLTDFGLARAMSAYHSYGRGSIRAIAYAAPEQFDEQHYAAASDLYSFGVVVYEMLTARRPFSAETMAGLLNAIANEPAPPPSQFRAGIEPEVDAVLQRALAKKPAERFATGKEFTQALASARQTSIERIAQERRAREQNEIERRERERQALLAEWLSQAERVRESDPAQALEWLDKIAQQEPDYAGVSDLRRRTEYRIAERAKDARLQTLFAKATKVVENDPQETLALVAQIASEAPDYPEIDDLRGRAEHHIAERERQARLAKLYADAQAVIETNPKQTMMWLAQIEKEELDYPGLSEAKTRAQEKLRFRFRSGGTAQDVTELVRLCEAKPQDAIWHLQEGHFEQWLKVIDQERLGKAATGIRGSVTSGLVTPERGLEGFLDATELSHTYRSIKSSGYTPPPPPPRHKVWSLLDNDFFRSLLGLVGCPLMLIVFIALPLGGAFLGMGLGLSAASGAVRVFGGSNWECLTVPIFTIAGFFIGIQLLNIVLKNWW